MRRAGLLVVIAILLAAACSGGDDDASPATTEAAGGTSSTEAAARAGGASGDGEGWTVLVYQVADTDLEPFALLDLLEMAEVPSTEGLNIVTLTDRAEEYAEGPALDLPDFTTAKLIEVGPGTLVEQADLGEVDMGDPATLADFVEYGVTTYPGGRYALMIWDHGAGWPGIGPDDSSGDMLDLADIEQGLSDGLGRAGLDRFDLLGFDACLMATLEVAGAVAPYADYMLASQELEPGHGWDYRSLSVVAEDPGIDAVGLGTAFADGFLAQAESEGTAADVTLSLVDLEQVGALQDAVSGLSGELADDIATVAPEMGVVRTRTLAFGSNPDPSLDTSLTDLGGLVGGLEGDGDAPTGAAEVLAALEQAVVYAVAGPTTQAATGLSVYFPPTPDLLSAEYPSLPSAASWMPFLDAFYAAGQAIPAEVQPQFLSPDGQAEWFFDQDGLNIAGTFDPAAEAVIADAYFAYGYVDPADGSTVFFGDEPAEWSTDGSGLAAGIYDLTYFTISDGVDTAQAYFSLAVDEEGGPATVDVPLAYYAPENIGTDTYQDAVLSIVVDPETGDVLQETYYAVDAETGSYGELFADPEGLIVPLVLNVYPDGTSEWLPTSDVGLFADLPNLAYAFEPVPSGTELVVELTIVDFGGNSSSVVAQDLAP